MQRQICNAQPCIGDEQCISQLDVILAIDGSGSMTGKGFTLMKGFAASLAAKFRTTAYGNNASRIAVIQFGNGHLDDRRVVSPAILALPFSSDTTKINSTINGLQWQKGFTNMAQALIKTQEIIATSSRRSAETLVVLITDGKPSFQRQTEEAVNKVRQSSRLLVVHIKAFPSQLEKKLMRHYASKPRAQNYVKVAGKKGLKTNGAKWIQKVLVQSCAQTESPSQQQALQSSRGFKLMRMHVTCNGIEGLETSHQPTPQDCFNSANVHEEWTFFTFNRDPITNSGQCTVYDQLCEDFRPAQNVEIYTSLDNLHRE